MKKVWTENTALAALKGADVKGKLITTTRGSGLQGLQACSALDYLVNHCGYRSRL